MRRQRPEVDLPGRHDGPGTHGEARPGEVRTGAEDRVGCEREADQGEHDARRTPACRPSASFTACEKCTTIDAVNSQRAGRRAGPRARRALPTTRPAPPRADSRATCPARPAFAKDSGACQRPRRAAAVPAATARPIAWPAPDASDQVCRQGDRGVRAAAMLATATPASASHGCRPARRPAAGSVEQPAAAPGAAERQRRDDGVPATTSPPPLPNSQPATPTRTAPPNDPVSRREPADHRDRDEDDDAAQRGRGGSQRCGHTSGCWGVGGVGDTPRIGRAAGQSSAPSSLSARPRRC